MSHTSPATAASPERFLAGDGLGAIMNVVTDLLAAGVWHIGLFMGDRSDAT